MLLRVKYYWKNLELLQSESVKKSLGMNTKAIFYPQLHMGRALKEACEIGLTRIEITYTAETVEAQNELLDAEFVDLSNINLSNAYLALQRTRGLGWHVPLKTLHQEFMRQACVHQLLVV